MLQKFIIDRLYAQETRRVPICFSPTSKYTKLSNLFKTRKLS